MESLDPKPQTLNPKPEGFKRLRKVPNKCRPRLTKMMQAAMPLKSYLGSGSQTSTWAPKVCKTMAFMAIIVGLGLLFCILWGFR